MTRTSVLRSASRRPFFRRRLRATITARRFILHGTTCPGGDGGSSPDTRNLLDFTDLTGDRFGRAVGGYADRRVAAGCAAITDKNNDGRLTKEGNDGASYAPVIRQTVGSRLFADFDPTVPSAAALPMLIKVAYSQKAAP